MYRRSGTLDVTVICVSEYCSPNASYITILVDDLDDRLDAIVISKISHCVMFQVMCKV